VLGAPLKAGKDLYLELQNGLPQRVCVRVHDVILVGGAGNWLRVSIIIWHIFALRAVAMAGSMLLVVSILLALSAVLVKSEGEAGKQANAATAFRPQLSYAARVQ